MDWHTKELGKQSGTLDLLVVRAFNYKEDYLNTLMDFVTNLFPLLNMPPNTKVVSIRLPKKWIAYPSVSCSYPYTGRFIFAIKVWRNHPAKWLAVMDGDVIPTRKTALIELHQFLMEEAKTLITTRKIFSDTMNVVDIFSNKTWFSQKSRFALMGATTAPMHGLICFHHKLIPLLQKIVCSFPISLFSEYLMSTTLPPINIQTFPPKILSLLPTYHKITITDSTPAFVHFAGGLATTKEYTNVMRTALDAWERLSLS